MSPRSISHIRSYGQVRHRGHPNRLPVRHLCQLLRHRRRPGTQNPGPGSGYRVHGQVSCILPLRWVVEGVLSVVQLVLFNIGLQGQCPKIAILLGCLSGKFRPEKDGESGKFEGKCGMNWLDLCRKLWWFQWTTYGLSGGVMTAINAKSPAESEKFSIGNEKWEWKSVRHSVSFPTQINQF